MRHSVGLFLGLAGFLVSGYAMAQSLSTEDVAKATADVDSKFIIENRAETKSWPTYGLDYQETRFSKLHQITADNVDQISLAWSTSLNSRRGIEATPIVVNGVMFVSASWSIVHAIDAKTGNELWTYDPGVPKEYGQKACCDVINRGVAVYEGKIFVGALDGYLHAIDAATGKTVWKVDTIEDRTRSYTITGAPRVYNGVVVIGNGGAEYGVRGYLSGYDVKTGERKWRWYSVPGDPTKPYEDASVAAAAKTWDPSVPYWEYGGGGTMWNAMAYDPELDLMYVGVGNGSPWQSHLRSPNGGDNLYLNSVVALRPSTGEFVCYYQEVPADNWDYTSVQDIILADIKINGELRKVFMHAPKSGFFYIADRTNCKFISAEPFVKVTWATGYDENGRPIVAPEARSLDKPWEMHPSIYGAHNWHAMSYNPQTGLVYIPTQGIPLVMQYDPDWKHNKNVPGKPMSNMGWNLGVLINTVAPQAQPFGTLVAWDPQQQKEVWRVPYGAPWNGGTLTTAGNLVFQGTADGRFIAYNAKTGKQLWETPVGTGVVAAPVTYDIDGTQYVSIAVGWGGVYGLRKRSTDRVGPGRVYTFAIGGKAKYPELTMRAPQELVSGIKYNPADVEKGLNLYVANCSFCHGTPGIDNGGAIPNLGYSAAETLEMAPEILLTGALAEAGMPNFAGKLTEDEVNKIVAFIQATADSVRQNQAK